MKPNTTTRREFAASCAAFGLHANESAAPLRIIDTHAHFYDPARPQGVPWPPKDDAILYQTTLPARYRKLTQPFGIVGTVVVEASAWLEDNQWVLDLAKENPFIVGLVGRLDPGTAEFRNHLARFRKNRLFLGVRVNAGALAERVMLPAFVADMKRLRDAELQLDVVGGPTMLVDAVRLSDQIPELRIVIDHLPFDPPKEPSVRTEVDKAMRELGGRPTVFAKISSVLRRSGGRVPAELSAYRSALDDVCNIFGTDRVIYGSNWPVSDRIAEYAAVLRVVREYFAEKGPEASEKYFRKNSMAAYRWIDRGA